MFPSGRLFNFDCWTSGSGTYWLAILGFEMPAMVFVFWARCHDLMLIVCFSSLEWCWSHDSSCNGLFPRSLTYISRGAVERTRCTTLSCNGLGDVETAVMFLLRMEARYLHVSQGVHIP